MISVTWPDCGRILRAAAEVHNFAIAETPAVVPQYEWG